MGRRKKQRGAQRPRPEAAYTLPVAANGVVMVDVNDARRVAFGPAVDESDEEARANPVCHVCGQPARRVDYAELEKFDPVAFEDLRDNFTDDEIFTCWICDSCDRFGFLIGHLDDDQDADYPDSGEDDYFDPELFCAACGSYDVLVGDPAMAMKQDRAGFLAARKEFGPAALLNGEAVWCQECGTIGYNPGPADGFSIYGGPVDGAWARP